MDHLYRITVDDDYTFEFRKSDLDKLSIQSPSTGLTHLLYKGKKFIGRIAKKPHKRTFRVEINGISHEVRIENSLDQLIGTLGLGTGGQSLVKDVFAPMPGRVLKVYAQEGVTLQKGDPLLVLEAMKMENTIRCPSQGTVRNVYISANQTVEKGSLLIELT